MVTVDESHEVIDLSDLVQAAFSDSDESLYTRQEIETLAVSNLTVFYTWAAVTALSGIVGNLAYDVIKATCKAALTRIRARSSRADSEQPDLWSRREREAAALLAVREWCRERQIEVPKSLSVIGHVTDHAEDVCEITLASLYPAFRAVVQMPLALDDSANLVFLIQKHGLDADLG